jgi:hypothetical protein
MMKKTILVLAIVTVGLSSCRKDRSCTCTDGSNNLGTFNYTNVKKSEAKRYCQSNQTQYQTSNPGAVCTVK